MNSTTSVLTERLEMFFESIRAHPIQIVSSSVIIGIALYVGVSIGLAELNRQNSYKIHMLASEMLIELGPDLAEESRRHAEMVKQYTEHIEEGYLAAILRVLYPTYSPKKALAFALSGLEKAAKEEKDEDERKFLYEVARSEDRRVKILEAMLANNMDDVCELLRVAIEGAFEKELLVENAPEACEDNRRTMLLLFLARLSYNSNSQKRFLDSFRRIVETYVKHKEEQTIKFQEVNPQEALLMIFVGSMQRRLAVLGAMSANDMDKVCVCVLFSLC